MRSLKGGQLQARKALKKDPLPDISNEVHKMRVVGKGADKEINKVVDEAYDNLNKQVKRKSEVLRLQNDKLELQQRAMTKHQNSFSNAQSNYTYADQRFKALKSQLERKKQHSGYDFDPSDPLVARVDLAEAKMLDAKRAMDNAENAFESAAVTFKARQNRVSDLSDEVAELKQLTNMASQNPQELVNRVDLDPSMGYRQPLIQEFVRDIAGPMAKKNMAYKAVSRNINNDRRFVKEYLKEIHGKDNPYANAWRQNPENIRKLTELEYNKRYTKYLSDIGDVDAAKSAVRKMNRADLAKSLGVSTAMTALPLALMSSVSNSADVIEQSSGDLVASLRNIDAEGLGEVIREKTLNAVIATNNIYDRSQRDMINDPEQTLTKLAEDLSKQQSIINDSIARWSIVVGSARNKEGAQRVAGALSQFNQKVAHNLKEMGTVVAKVTTPTRTEGPSQAGTIKRPGIDRGNIRAVQEYLSQYDPSVASTGFLDRPTVVALRGLEQEFNRAHGSDAFTGRILNTKLRRVMSLDDIKKTKKFLNIP